VAAHTTACTVIVLLKEVTPVGVVGRQVGQQGLPQLSMGLPGTLCVRPPDCLVVVEGAERQVVDVDPYLAAPVRGVMSGVVLLVQAAAWGQGPASQVEGGSISPGSEKYDFLPHFKSLDPIHSILHL
jgi:hypothetical protein